MKVFIKIILFTMLLKQNVSAQNVGIGTTIPLAKLDINGDIVLRNADIILSNGANDNIDISSQKFSHYTISGPITVFEIGGLTGGVDGRMVTLYNSSAFLMVIKHLSAGSIAANEIHTGTGLDFTLSSYSSATFRYLSLDNLWHIQSTHNDFVTGSGTNYWAANGVDVSNTNTGNIGIGNASPSFKLDVTGNQRNTGTAMTSPGGVGNLTSGGIFKMQNTFGNKFLLFDGSTVQAQQSNTNFSGSTAQPLLLNPFGSNVGIGYNIPTATLDVGRGTGASGTAAFRGTTHVSHINFGTAEDTYIRAGKTGSKVYINDSHNGDVNIAAAGGNVNIESNNMYAPQTGNLNLVPLGIIHVGFSTNRFNEQLGSVSNIAGNAITGTWGADVFLLGGGPVYPGKIVFIITLNPNVVSSYSKIITIGHLGYFGGGFTFENYITTNTSTINLNYASNNTTGRISIDTDLMIYGVK